MKKQSKRKTIVELVILYSALVLIATSATLIGNYIKKDVNTGQTPAPTPKVESPSQYPDYDALRGSNPDKNINLVRITDGCDEGGCIYKIPATVDSTGINKNYKVTGTISRGYLYIEAAVDQTRPLTNYDDFFFMLDYKAGHLVADSALLPVPPSQISRYLFDLRNVSYKSRGLTRNINLLESLRDSKIVNVHTFVSTGRPDGVLKEVAIYYQCAEGSSCSIEEINK